jgi:hypothetical protein
MTSWKQVECSMSEVGSTATAVPAGVYDFAGGTKATRGRPAFGLRRGRLRRA